MTRSKARRELEPKCRPRDTLIARKSHPERPGVFARGWRGSIPLRESIPFLRDSRPFPHPNLPLWHLMQQLGLGIGNKIVQRLQTMCLLFSIRSPRRASVVLDKQAVGAPKFVAAPGVGFRAERLSD